MVISLSEFTDLTEKQKAKTIQDLKNEIGVTGITEAWGISRSKAYSILHQLNIPTSTKESTESKTKRPKVSFREKNNNVGTGNEVHNTGASREKKRPATNRRTPKASRSVSHKDSLDFEEVSKSSSVQVDIQGDASTISQTLQLLIGSSKFASSYLHLSLRIEEV
ncbi:MAG TPA: hypothetical protein VN426_09535 [Syntrophomonadaceae bacterium]|nr:hypothetical protein [Syntrophomonadaceae bacterium]